MSARDGITVVGYEGGEYVRQVQTLFPAHVRDSVVLRGTSESGKPVVRIAPDRPAQMMASAAPTKQMG